MTMASCCKSWKKIVQHKIIKAVKERRLLLDDIYFPLQSCNFQSNLINLLDPKLIRTGGWVKSIPASVVFFLSVVVRLIFVRPIFYKSCGWKLYPPIDSRTAQRSLKTWSTSKKSSTLQFTFWMKPILKSCFFLKFLEIISIEFRLDASHDCKYSFNNVEFDFSK